MRTEAVSAPVRRLMERVERAEARRPGSEVARLVGQVIGEEFASRWRLGRAAGGVLDVLVDDIRLVGVFRLRWALELAEKFPRELPRTGIRKVRFAVDIGAGKA